jgi:hypothetical protein
LVLVIPSHDPYGLFHLSLNKRPGEDTEPLTEWLNMGFWKVCCRLCRTATIHRPLICRIQKSFPKLVMVRPIEIVNATPFHAFS